MTEPVSLIVRKSRVPRMAVGPTKATQPHLAVVYTTASGEVECFEGRPIEPSQLRFSKYRTRYEVDLRSWRRTAVLGRNPLVSRDGVHCFEVTVSFSFRVDGWPGAEAWVRSGLPDAPAVVHGHVIDLFQGAGEQFAIEDFFQLQRHLNQLCAVPVILQAGLMVERCRVSVRPDAKSQAHLESLIAAGRREELGAAEHRPNLGDTYRKAELSGLQQRFEIAARARQADALPDALITSEGMIRYYLATRPDDVAGAFGMMRQLEETRAAAAELQNQRALGLFQVMAEKGLIQAGDLEQMRQLVTGAVGRATGSDGWLRPVSTPQLPGARPWDDPQPQFPAASATDMRPSVPTVTDLAARQVAPPAALTQAALIYLVLDESLDPGCLDELNRGLRDTHSALSETGHISAVLRLCVLGMAATTETRLHLERVESRTRTPILTRRPGLSYTHAFSTLRLLLDQDVTMVKNQGVQVLRPIVHFLTCDMPDETDAWQGAHRELTDKGVNPAAPEVIAIGLGRADAHVVSAVATHPEFGFMAPSHQDAVSAAHTYAAFLRDSVVGYGQRIASGDSRFSVNAPDGFRRAEDAL